MTCGRALGRDVDVGFEIGVLVDGGQHGGRRNVVAEMHRNIADDAGKGRANLVVGQLLLLRIGQGDGGIEVALGVLVGLHRLIVGLLWR